MWSNVIQCKFCGKNNIVTEKDLYVHAGWTFFADKIVLHDCPKCGNFQGIVVKFEVNKYRLPKGE